MLTQSRLKELLSYSEDTGLFTWTKPTSNRVKQGDMAGCINKQDGYIVIRLDTKLYLAHRLVFLYTEGAFPGEQVDHINHKRHDNRLCNLRHATDVVNSKNKVMSSKNSSGITGVSIIKATGKWRASISVNNKAVNLGHFDDWFEAVCARKSAENRLGYHPNHGRSNAS